ncbi:MAG: PAS domain S-box protein, partial [Planctomycetes bacterium]|nr:PAS domain S-box protein [Planctomycetota bacterium]
SLVFWWPIYRLTGLVKGITALVSCGGVFILIRAFPQILDLKHPSVVQREIDARQQAQTALEHEQFLFQTLLDQLPDAIYFKDTEGRFLRVSRALTRHLGFTNPEDVIGRSDIDFFPAEYAARARDDERHVMDSRQPIIGREEHPIWRGGGESYVSTTKCPLISPDGVLHGTLGISHDITAIKEQESALAASEERYALAVKGSSDGIWDWNIPTNEVYYSDRFKELLGYGHDEFPAQLETFASHLHPDDYEPTFAAVQLHLENHVPYDVTYRLRTKMGDYRWFRARGQALWNHENHATRMAGSITDVTEQHRAEERFRQAVEASPAGMVIFDREGTILLANSQLARYFGYSQEELLGNSVDRLVPDSVRPHQPELRSAYFENPETRLMGSGRDLRARRKDGSEFDIEIGLSPLRTERGLTVLCSVIDITERRQNLLALKAAKEAAESANRAKSDFLANISHEIRTPMNAIIGMTELVLDSSLTNVQRSYLSTVAESADVLLEIINEILDFSKIEAGHFELEHVPFSLRETIGDALKALAIRDNSKELELAWQVVTDVHDSWCGDPTRLRQIVINLVGNAIKFTERGEVVVRVEWGEDRSSGELHFSVRDTGIGIPVDRQIKIFEPFTQADMSTTRQYGGTGLGLSISATLVRMMKGRIWVESKVGHGS